MFEAVMLGHRLAKEEFKQREDALRIDLLNAQQALKKANKAVLIIVAGIDGAAKSDVIDTLNKWLDTRNIQVHAFWNHTEEETERPFYWRFWRRLPARGSIGIFFGGWYWQVLRDYAFGRIEQAGFDQALRLIEETETMLHDDNMAVIKLWFHISEAEQKQRLKARKAQYKKIPVLREDLKIRKKYRQYVKGAERAIRLTDKVECPWHLIDASDASYRDITAGQVILEAMHKALDEKRHVERRREIHKTTLATEPDKTVLDQLDMSPRNDTSVYRRELEKQQQRLHELAWRCFAAQRSVVLVFEGWDAAGKGGAIRRISMAMDARLYRSISIGAPTDEELAQQYLWRFWRHLPRAGYFTLYDRSWYGRVLVERVEKFASEHEWGRAYQEINDFEEQLVEHGIILQKFWLHIDKEVQLARFKAREEVAWKQYKLGPDDWRNRDKWDAYKLAVHEMVARTSTARAPWSLIPGNDKAWARAEILRSVCDKIELALQ